MIDNNRGNSISVQDKHYIVGWSLADTTKVQRYTEMLASLYGKPEFANKYTELADKMVNLIQKRHNDHHNATAELGHDWLRVDPLDTKIGEDMVTFQGLNKLLKIYIGTASGVFKWMGKSSAGGTPTPYSTSLATESGSRQDASSTGFHDVKGSSLRIFSSYSPSVASTTIFQIGIFDASTSGTMLAIHDFGGESHTHTIAADSFSLGIIIDMVPFGDV